jgi:cubilin
MDIIEKKTCFIFEEKTKDEYKDKHSLEIEASGYSCRNGCYGGVTTSLISEVVKLKSYTQVNNKEVCELECGGFILHELMHVLGVGHTQKRKDRDQYIEIIGENLKDSRVAEQFEICTHCTLYDEIPYDCDSIMHYGTHLGNKELYKPKDPNTCKLERISKMDKGPKGSYWDWKLLNIIGKCPKCVTSPGYPKKYPHKSNNKQTFKVKDGQAIEITFDHFDVEVEDSCSYDYLKFFDANENAVGEKMCGQDLPPKLTIKTSTASALFVSDGSVNNKGYKFCYKPLDSSIKCVTSPGYPNHYPDNSDTSELLSVAAGHKIEITFHHFDVEPEATCSYDYLQFIDAYGQTVGKKLCGKSLPEKLTISTSLASAYFSSDVSETKTGYKFCYRPV